MPATASRTMVFVASTADPVENHHPPDRPPGPGLDNRGPARPPCASSWCSREPGRPAPPTDAPAWRSSGSPRHRHRHKSPRFPSTRMRSASPAAVASELAIASSSHEKGVEVSAGGTSGHTQPRGVDVVRSLLERPHLDAAVTPAHGQYPALIRVLPLSPESPATTSRGTFTRICRTARSRPHSPTM